MSIPGSVNPLFLGAAGQATGGDEIQIERSLRFNSPDSAYLSRTPASSGNRKTWTWAGWVKKSSIDTSSGRGLLNADITSTSDSTFFELRFGTAAYANSLAVGGWDTNWRITTQVFRDASAWYHIVLAVDTTQAAGANRIKIYVNGVQVTSFVTLNDPTQNSDLGINNTTLHNIGKGYYDYLNGYLADIHFIDGQALTPSSFTEVSATTGQLVPIEYTGTYGTNGFYLDFSDNSAATAATLGADTSGNGNNWTPNNLSVTAGSGNDSLVDTPTSYGTDTGTGGEVRGNYCTWNPLGAFTKPTLSNGNLDYSNSGTGRNEDLLGTFAIPSSGKWYFEFTPTVFNSSTGSCRIGIARNGKVDNANTIVYNATGSFETFNVEDTAPNSYTQGDVIGVAVDVGATTVYFYKNNTLEGSKTFSATDQYFPFTRVFQTSGSTTRVTNFGQRPFAYAAPSGFKALCDTNLPAPVVAKPNEVMDVVLYTGNGSARSITGLAFNPDFVWIKGRSGATDHALYDAVRGVQLDLVSNSTAAETTQAQGLTAFNSDGFSLGTLAKLNTNAATYAGWAWDAGTSTVTNTSGSISSQVRANASAGFSVVGWNYPIGSPVSTIGHGLGVKPSFIIIKTRDVSSNWIIYHTSTGATKCFRFNTAAASTETDPFNNTEPTSSVFTIGAGSWWGGGNMIAYCFAPVDGYSSFGSYTGNGSADGPFIFTSFMPRWVMIKASSFAGESWYIFDTVRNTYNVIGEGLVPNLSIAEFSSTLLDVLSNGFKIRAVNTLHNTSSATYIYAAFAEHPFAYARAR